MVGQWHYYLDALLRKGKLYIRSPLYTGLKLLNLASIEDQSAIESHEILWKARAQESVEFTLPISNISYIGKPFVGLGMFNLKHPFLVVKKKIRVISKAAVPFDRRNRIIGYNLVSENYYKNRFIHISCRALLSSILPSSCQKPPRTLEHACCMVNGWSKSYFHWIIEFLPRIIIMKIYLKNLAAWPYVIINSSPTTWQLRSLELLGVPEEKIICSNQDSLVENFYIPSFPREIVLGKNFSVISPLLIKQLRENILSHFPENKDLGTSENILVSRRNAPGRRIINESDLLAILKPYGFTSWSLEELSFDDQVKLFATAKFVIAPHGAGLSNIIFCRNSIKTIELYANSITPNFYRLASCLGFKYGRYKCEGIASINSKRNNMKVNVEEFLDFFLDFNKDS